MTRNKVHKLIKVEVGKKEKYRALCGVDIGGNSENSVPRAKENRDVTCRRCKRILKLKTK